MENKKSKIIIALVSIIIFIQIAYISYSYLQDRQTFDNTVDITVGFIKLTKIDNVWTYTSTGIDINDERGAETLTVNNITSTGKLRPGDQYTKNVTVKNTGDLSANVKINPNLSPDILAMEDTETPPNKLFLLKVENVTTTGVTPAPAITNNNGIYELKNINPNGEVSFNIVFEVNKNYTEKNGSSDKTVSSKLFSVVVDGVQTNAPFPNN